MIVGGYWILIGQLAMQHCTWRANNCAICESFIINYIPKVKQYSILGFLTLLNIVNTKQMKHYICRIAVTNLCLNANHPAILLNTSQPKHSDNFNDSLFQSFFQP